MSAVSAGIPDSFLATFPITPPPAGLKSNFVNPPDSGWSFIIVGAVLLPVMSVFLGIRIYSKLFIIGKSSWDDLTCLIAAFGTIIYYIIMLLGYRKGGTGRHGWDISLLMSIQPWFAWPVYVINWLGTLILPFTKIAFFIFYLQVFRPLRWVRISCYLGIASTSVAFTGLWIAQMVYTTPHPKESWLEMYQDPRELVALNYLSIPVTATSFAIDIFTFVLPIAAVATLKLSPRRKLGVVLVFLTGLAAVVSSFLGLYFKIVLNNNKSDATWNAIPVGITLLTEMSVGVICASMPSLAKFVAHKFPNFSILNSMMSLKWVSYLTSRTRSGFSSNPSRQTNPQRQGFKKFSPKYSKENETTSEVPPERQDLELGVNKSTKTYIESGRVIEMNHLSGIHMEREWVVEGNQR